MFVFCGDFSGGIILPGLCLLEDIFAGKHSDLNLENYAHNRKLSL